MRTTDKVITPKDQESTGAVRSAAADTDIEEHTEGAEITDFTADTGTIRRVEQTPTEAGNMRSRDAVTTPKDQTSTSEDHSAARDATETLHTEGATIANKAAAAGTIRQVQETPTEAGNVRTTDKVITPKDQESTSVIKAADEETTIAEHTEGPEITDLDADAGTIRRVEQTPTEAGNMRTRDAVTVRKDQSIATGNVVKTPRQTSAIAIFDGSNSAPEALESTEYGRVYYKQDKFGKFVGEREVTVYHEEFTIPGWTLNATTYNVAHPLRTTVDRVGYKREIGYTISVLQTNSASAAIAHCGSSGALVGTEAGSSHYEPLANGQYKAILITAWASGTTAWTADAGGDLP